MTLCDTGYPYAFMSMTDVYRRALLLIHEGLHGITISQAPTSGPPPAPTGATDFGYRWQRVIRFLDTRTALQNNDTYVLFVSAVNNLDTSSGANIPDQQGVGEQASRAVAYLQGWLIWANQQMRTLYAEIVASRAAHAWQSSFYRDLMGRIAPLFGMTPPLFLPSEEDQVKVAGIADRLARLEPIPTDSLQIRRSQGEYTHWEEGPRGPLTLARDFYNFPGGAMRNRSQAELILRRLLEAAPDIDLKEEYVRMIEEIRQQRGGSGLQP